MPAITEASSLTDVAFAVCTVLQHAGTVAVLTGGSAATYYAPESCQSGDADFIITFQSDPARAGDAVRSLGYREFGGIYHHDENLLTLEFPRGPLAVGDDLISSYDTVRRRDEVLHVISRTDSVRDRLIWFYVYTDRSALAAAVAVASSGPVDLALIERWSKRGRPGVTLRRVSWRS